MNVSTQALTATSINCDTYNATTVATTMSIAGYQTSGQLYIGTGSRTSSAHITIGNGDALNNTYIRGAEVNINDIGTSTSINTGPTSGNVYIGSTTNTIYVNRPITPAYSYPIAAGNIGCEVKYTGGTTFTTPAGSPCGLSLINLTAGVWALQGYAEGFSDTQYSYLGFNNVNNVLGSFGTNYVSCYNAGINFMYTVIPISPATTQEWFMICQTQYSRNITSIRMSAFRIA
jgi:hypothetical protein